MIINKKEKISFYSHLAGAVASIAGTILLVFKAWGFPPYVFVSIVYGFSIVFLFSSSSLYHALKKKDNEISVWRKLDHIAIFIMIAGSYTPFCYIYLTDPLRMGIIILQWVLVLLGLFFKLFYLNAPRILNTLIYVMMGWCIIFIAKPVFMALPLLVSIYVVTGGIAYSAGALIYGLKRPDPVPGFFGFHEIFHVFCLLGCMLQFIGVYYALHALT